VSDLRQRVPGQSLIEKLLEEWDAGRIHFDARGDVVIDEEARGWYDGVLGERQTALELSLLGPEWTVLHSVPINERGTDLDHIAIGPSGVYVINSKRHPGKTVTAGGAGMRLDGNGVRYIPSAAGQTRQAAERLSAACGFAVPVTGILSFVDVRSISIRAPLHDQGTPVVAVRESEIATRLNGRRALSDDQIASVVDAATRAGTWSRSALSARNGTHMLQEFAALERAVQSTLAPRGRAMRPPPTAAARPRRAAPVRASHQRMSLLARLVTALVAFAVCVVVVPVVFIVALGLIGGAIAGATHVSQTPPAPAITTPIAPAP
jgi:hypothetical protein